MAEIMQIGTMATVLYSNSNENQIITAESRY